MIVKRVSQGGQRVLQELSLFVCSVIKCSAKDAWSSLVASDHTVGTCLLHNQGSSSLPPGCLHPWWLRDQGQMHDPIASSNLHTQQFVEMVIVWHFVCQQGLVFLDDVVLSFSDDLHLISMWSQTCKKVASFALQPVAERISGVMEACLTSLICCS